MKRLKVLNSQFVGRGVHTLTVEVNDQTFELDVCDSYFGYMGVFKEFPLLETRVSSV